MWCFLLNPEVLGREVLTTNTLACCQLNRNEWKAHWTKLKTLEYLESGLLLFIINIRGFQNKYLADQSLKDTCINHKIKL